MMHMKLKALCLMMVLMVTFTSNAMAASGQHEVTASRLNFREQPSASAETIGRLKRGEIVTVLNTEDGWAKARWEGKTGYLSCEYLEKITSASESGSNTTALSGTAV